MVKEQNPGARIQEPESRSQERGKKANRRMGETVKRQEPESSSQGKNLVSAKAVKTIYRRVRRAAS
jgi:hypothetical protein